MDPTAPTPAELLRRELGRDAARPFVTFYDDATGERVELSVTTFDNWVAKTSGFLQGGLGADPGDRVALILPAHWQSLVWAAACWATGTCAVTQGFDDVTVAVAGPDAVDAAWDTRASDVVAMSLRPLGGRFTTPLRAGTLDYAVEVPGWPDRFAPIARAEPIEPGLDAAGAVHTLGGLVELAVQRAEQLGAGPGARVLVATDDLRAAAVDALLVPLVAGGSAVLVRHEDPSGREARVRAERVTTVVDAPAAA